MCKSVRGLTKTGTVEAEHAYTALIQVNVGATVCRSAFSAVMRRGSIGAQPVCQSQKLFRAVRQSLP